MKTQTICTTGNSLPGLEVRYEIQRNGKWNASGIKILRGVTTINFCSDLQAIDALRTLDEQKILTLGSSVTVTEGVKCSATSQYVTHSVIHPYLIHPLKYFLWLLILLNLFGCVKVETFG